MYEKIIKCEDGDITITVDDSLITHCVDFKKLDEDLLAISNGKVDCSSPDIDEGDWETKCGKEIGLICAQIDNGEFNDKCE